MVIVEFQRIFKLRGCEKVQTVKNYIKWETGFSLEISQKRNFNWLVNS